jgi:hypothetical protein
VYGCNRKYPEGIKIMFPDLVTVQDLDQSKIELSDNYLVAPLKNATKNYQKKNELVGKFNGLNALFEYQKKYQAKPKQAGSSDGNGGGGNFNHFKSFNQAVDTYLSNPGSIVEFSQKDDVIEGGESSGRELIHDVTGDFLDVGRYLEGEPECFGSLTNGNPRNKRVAIALNLTWWADVDKETINYRASRIIRLVDWLESQSIRTSIVGLSSGGCEHLEIMIKKFDEPLNINDLAVTAHSDFLRRVIFRFDEYSASWHSGYGNAHEFSDSYNPKDWEPEYNEEYSLFIDGGMQADRGKINKAFDVFEVEFAKVLADEYSSKRVFKIIDGTRGDGGKGFESFDITKYLNLWSKPEERKELPF